MKSGKETFQENYTDPEAGKRATEAQKKAGERLIKARKARESSAETKPAANPADIQKEPDELLAKKEGEKNENPEG